MALTVAVSFDADRVAGKLPAVGKDAVAESFMYSHAAKRGRLDVIAGGVAGAMYALLDLAEHVEAGILLRQIAEDIHTPAAEFRGIKFNLPWMSYRRHESLQLHDAACRDLDFWRDFIDMLAVNRFNVLSLWSLHPFHYMIRPHGFEQACDMPDDELAGWQSFWRNIMRMAHDRCIQVHLFWWNIFVSPALAEAHDVARYSIDWDYFGEGDTSELVQRYNRQCVKQLIDEYADLDGIGVAMSERMGGMTPAQRGRWVIDTIVAGMKDASRQVQFNLRIPHSADTFSGGSTSRSSEQLGRELLVGLDAGSKVWTEIKFNWSHGHSTPKLCLIHGGQPSDVLWNPPPTRYSILWMVRNEDFFVLRWGDAAFVREHIARNLFDGVGGYFVGSECYIPAADFITRDGGPADWRWAFQRQWLFYMLWGRLLYEPTTSDDVFARQFAARYDLSDGDASRLLAAVAHASRVPQTIATFAGFTWDHTLYTEGLLTRDGIITVEQLQKCRPVDPDWVSVEQYVAAVRAGGSLPTHRLTPPQVVNRILADAEAALAGITGLDAAAGKPLEYELADVRAWALLGLHFACKLRAALAAAMDDKATAARLLGNALRHWDELVAVTEPLYREVPLQHLGERPFSWRALRPDVAAEERRWSEQADL